MDFPSGTVVRICLPMQEVKETQVWSLGWKDILEKGMATHFRTLAWKIPWTEEPGGLPSMGSQTVGHGWAHILQDINTKETKTTKKHNFNIFKQIFKRQGKKYVDIILLVNSLTTLWNRCSLKKTQSKKVGKIDFKLFVWFQIYVCLS